MLIICLLRVALLIRQTSPDIRATFDLITVHDDNSSVNIFLAKIEVPCTDAVGGTAVVGSNSICRGSSTTITLSGYQGTITVSYTHLRAHETRHDLVCRLL